MADTRDDGSLQSEIAGALARDPKLTGSAIQVRVDDSSVTLEGRAAGSQQHLQAQRLAKSYAWNRKLVDHILVDRAEAPPSMAAHK
jgi:osmotically-inducible protein OsmY